MKSLVAFAQILMFLVFAQGATGASIYVSDSGTGLGTIASPASLWDALATAKANGEDDTVFLQVGRYSHDPAFVYDVSGPDTTSLTLSGGWNETYAVQDPDPTLTLLDGQDARRVLKIQGDGAGVDVTVTLANLTVERGLTNTYLGQPPLETGYGAGVYVVRLNGALVKLVMNRCTVRDNEATHGSSSGGGLYSDGHFELRGCAFTGNTTVYAGGAVSAHYAAPLTSALAPVIDECYFADNRSTASGGSHLFTSVSPVVTDSAFRGLTGGGSMGGGAVNPVNGAHPVFDNCEFTGNVSDYWGGAFYFHDAGAEFRNCLFEGNEAGGKGSGGYGGAITAYAPPGDSTLHTVRIVNSTFVGNRVPLGWPLGGAIYNRVQTLVVVNSIFWDNGTSATKGGTYALYKESGSASISYSDVEGGLDGTNFTGDHNITDSPISGYSWGHPYRIPEDSPCVDAGDNVAAETAGLIADWEGQPRIFGGNNPAVRIVDMGRDEYYDGVLSVTSPAKGSVWVNNGAPKTITWTCTNIPGNVRLSLWRESPANDGEEVTEIAADIPCSNQTYTWTGLSPNQPPGDNYALVIESGEMPALVEWSYFEIQRTLRLTFPDGGQELTQGSTYKITWRAGGLPGEVVRIQLYAGVALSRTLAAGAGNTGSFTWKVPYAQPPGGSYRIRLSTNGTWLAEDWSDAPFRILPAVTLTAPNGGQSIKRGTAYRVTWTYKNKPGGFVRLELYKGAILNRTIVASTPVGAAGKGSFLWRVPATQTPAKTYTVKVRSATNPNCFDFSNKPFTITK